MENQNIEAIENAAGQAELLSEIDAVATENHRGHIIPVVDIIIARLQLWKVPFHLL